MISFFAAIVVLILGYLYYGKLMEKVFGFNPERAVPAIEKRDGVDYVPLPWYKAFLIQLLNIAGLGPIFGAVAGALWGPAVFLWIAIGGIVVGAVHDYMIGMISVRHDGKNVPEIVAQYMGKGMKYFTNVFIVVLLVLVGTVFVSGPAGLLAGLTPGFMDARLWIYIIVAYYFLATLLPIDKIIAPVYPVFGALLLIMSVGVGGAIILGGNPIPEISLVNLHPRELPIWPLMFITVACGAVSGFHSTQSPIMARCLQNEKLGRKVFFGPMIVESVIAMIWAAASMAFFGTTQALADAGAAPVVVRAISFGLLGTVGGTLAILGVVVLPITSGDTAFRAARYVISEFFKFDQVKIKNRYIIAVPLLALGFALTYIDFGILWRYFAWSNQTVAAIVLWTASIYLLKNSRNYWVTLIPATFMTAVTVTYILQAPEGFSLSTDISYPVGIIVAIILFAVFVWKAMRPAGSMTAAPSAGK